jgi:hypothetical protein
MQDGSITVPDEPGLGIELNREALESFEEAARKVGFQQDRSSWAEDR